MDTDVIVDLTDMATDAQELDTEGTDDQGVLGAAVEPATWTSVANPRRTRV